LLDPSCFFQKYHDDNTKCKGNIWKMLGKTINRRRRRGEPVVLRPEVVAKLNKSMSAQASESEKWAKEKADLLAQLAKAGNCDHEIDKIMNELQNPTQPNASVSRIAALFATLRTNFDRLLETAKTQNEANIAQLKAAQEAQTDPQKGLEAALTKEMELNDQITRLNAELAEKTAMIEAQKQVLEKCAQNPQSSRYSAPDAETERIQLLPVDDGVKRAFETLIDIFATDEMRAQLRNPMNTREFTEFKAGVLESMKSTILKKINDNQACIAMDETTAGMSAQWTQQIPTLPNEDASFVTLKGIMAELTNELTELNGGVGQIFLKISPQTAATSHAKFVDVNHGNDKRAIYYHIGNPNPVDSGVPEFREIFNAANRKFKPYFEAEVQQFMRRIEKGRQVVTPIFMAFGQSGSGKSWSLCGNQRDGLHESILDTIYEQLTQKGIQAHFSIKQYYCLFDANRDSNVPGQGQFIDVNEHHPVHLDAVNGILTDKGAYDPKPNLRNVQMLKHAKVNKAYTYAEYDLQLDSLRNKYDKGRIERTMSALNKNSSRSHVFITITFTVAGKPYNIYIVDLAGNEGVYDKTGKGTANIISQEMLMIQNTLSYVRKAVESKRTTNKAPPSEVLPYSNFVKEINDLFFGVKSKVYFVFTIRGFYAHPATDSVPNRLIYNTGVGSEKTTSKDFTANELVTFPFAKALLSSLTATCAVTGGKRTRKYKM
jgi:hypothetical protein